MPKSFDWSLSGTRAAEFPSIWIADLDVVKGGDCLLDHVCRKTHDIFLRNTVMRRANHAIK